MSVNIGVMGGVHRGPVAVGDHVLVCDDRHHHHHHSRRCAISMKLEPENELSIDGKHFEFPVSSTNSLRIDGERVLLNGEDITDEVQSEGEKTKVVYRTLSVVIKGNIGGDVSAERTTVTVEGSVTGKVHVKEGDLSVGGNCEGAVLAQCSDVDVAGNCTADVACEGGKLTVRGSCDHYHRRRLSDDE